MTNWNMMRPTKNNIFSTPKMYSSSPNHLTFQQLTKRIAIRNTVTHIAGLTSTVDHSSVLSGYGPVGSVCRYFGSKRNLKRFATASTSAATMITHENLDTCQLLRQRLVGKRLTTP